MRHVGFVDQSLGMLVGFGAAVAVGCSRVIRTG